MLWQVVPSTSTRKSINLDLARAARYFTKNRPAHADQNSDQSILLLAVNLPAVRVGHGVGPGWERSHQAGLLVADRHHTRTHRHATHIHTHTLTSHNQFLQVYSYTTALTLERDMVAQPSSILGLSVCVCVNLCGLTCFVCLCLCAVVG